MEAAVCETGQDVVPGLQSLGETSSLGNALDLWKVVQGTPHEVYSCAQGKWFALEEKSSSISIADEGPPLDRKL